MLVEEARWLYRHLSTFDPDHLYPLCNIGSSTEYFRCTEQPYIDKYLFAPARKQSRKVIHVDMKPAPGVDLVGDLTDPNFLTQLAGLNIRSVMCCNVLEHVRHRELICHSILSVLRAPAYIIATVPFDFPYHEDPIDTMYRPNVSELVGLFPGTSICRAKILRASRFEYEMKRNYWDLSGLILRSAAPFYRPRSWWRSIETLKTLARGYRVTCVILRKTGEPAVVPPES